ELERELKAVIEEVRPQGQRDFGAVMKAASARLAGRAEGGRIAAVVRSLIGSERSPPPPPSPAPQAPGRETRPAPPAPPRPPPGPPPPRAPRAPLPPPHPAPT